VTIDPLDFVAIPCFQHKMNECFEILEVIFQKLHPLKLSTKEIDMIKSFLLVEKMTRLIFKRLKSSNK